MHAAATQECRINALPDSVLIAILSLLPIKTAVRSSILSRRWRHLWFSIPMVHLHESEHLGDGKDGFASVVDRFLVCHVGRLRSFHLDFCSQDSKADSSVNQWIRNLAAVRRVEELSLNFMNRKGLPKKLQFDYSEYGSLLALRLSTCYFELPPRSNGVLCSLKTLYLGYVSLSKELFEGMICGCPLLEDLTVECCHCLKDAQIEAPHLTSLSFINCNDLSNLVVKAPCLQLFKMHCRALKLEKGGLDNLVEGVAHVTVLEVCGCFLQALGRWKERIKQQLFRRLEKLTLLDCRTESFQAETSALLLQCSHSLGYLAIENERFCHFLSCHKYHAFCASGCNLPCLRRMMISLFSNSESEVKLVEGFLKNSPVLESIVIFRVNFMYTPQILPILPYTPQICISSCISLKSRTLIVYVPRVTSPFKNEQKPSEADGSFFFLQKCPFPSLFTIFESLFHTHTYPRRRSWRRRSTEETITNTVRAVRGSCRASLSSHLPQQQRASARERSKVCLVGGPICWRKQLKNMFGMLGKQGIDSSSPFSILHGLCFRNCNPTSQTLKLPLVNVPNRLIVWDSIFFVHSLQLVLTRLNEAKFL